MYKYGSTGAVVLKGVNLIEDGSLAGALTGDPRLSSLQNNGGPTLTHIPLEESIVLSAGSYGELPKDALDLDEDGDSNEPIPFDQRGDGFFRAINGAVDLGAVQVQLIDTDGDGIPDINDLDDDNDGLPDDWEILHGLNPIDASDALQDPDNDGYSTLREALSGTDPVPPYGNTDSPFDVDPGFSDLDEDGDIDGLDLSCCALEFNRTDCGTLLPCRCDLDNNGDVNKIDLQLFLEDYPRIY